MQDPPIAGADAASDEIDVPSDGFDNERAWIASGAMRRDQPAPFAPAPPIDPNAPQTASRFLIDWIDAHRESAHPADPDYPEGIAIDVAQEAPRACRVQLESPAKGRGLWVISCRACGYAIALATAGRADDPCSVRVPCRSA